VRQSDATGSFSGGAGPDLLCINQCIRIAAWRTVTSFSTFSAMRSRCSTRHPPIRKILNNRYDSRCERNSIHDDRVIEKCILSSLDVIAYLTRLNVGEVYTYVERVFSRMINQCSMPLNARVYSVALLQAPFIQVQTGIGKIYMDARCTVLIARSTIGRCDRLWTRYVEFNGIGS